MNPAILLALACVAAWSFIPVVARLGQSNLDNIQFLFWSNLLSSLVILGALAASGRTGELKRYSGAKICQCTGLGFLGCCFYYLCLYYGYAKAPGIEVLVLQYTWPALIVLFSLPILGERLSLRKGTAVALGFLGVIIVLTKGNPAAVRISEPRVLCVVLLGAASFALFSVLSKRIPLEPYSSVFYFFAFATLFSGAALFLFSSFAWPARSSLVPVIANGALINGISYLFWIRALSLTEASRIAPLVFLAPVLSTIWLVAIFGEPFHSAYLLGLGLTVVSGLMVR